MVGFDAQQAGFRLLSDAGFSGEVYEAFAAFRPTSRPAVTRGPHRDPPHRHRRPPPAAGRLEVRVVRRLSAEPARLRGPAARGRGPGRDLVLPRGDERHGRRPLRRVAGRRIRHDPARRRADPGDPPQLPAAGHDRSVRHGRRHPGAPQRRRRRRVHVDRVRPPRVHLHAGDLDRDRRPRPGGRRGFGPPPAG